jgi:hypothetical protein
VRRVGGEGGGRSQHGEKGDVFMAKEDERIEGRGNKKGGRKRNFGKMWPFARVENLQRRKRLELV